MNKKTVFTRIFAVMLSAVMISALLLPAAYAVTNPCTADDYSPFVVVHGDMGGVKTNPDGTTSRLFDDGDYVNELLSRGVPSIAKGVLTGNWDEYVAIAEEVFMPAFEGFAPNLDGSLDPSVKYDANFDPADAVAAHSYDMTYARHFSYDFRLSPLDGADLLNTYLEAVREKTGHEKVVLIGRCGGAAALLAYLNKYERPRNYAGVECVIFSDGTIGGVEYMEAIYSGTVKVCSGALDRYINGLGPQDSSTETMRAAFGDVVQLLKETYSIDVSMELVERVYEQLKDTLIADILRAYYVRVLSNWGCIVENYDKAMAYLFPTQELRDEYAYFIEKIEAYHEQVQLNRDAILKEMAAQGISVNFVADYGFQQNPFHEKADEVGDMLCGLARKTLGATVSNVDGTLPAAYVTRQTVIGKGGYISPDKQVDTSTCMFPDNTWVIKNNNHESIAWPEFALFTKIARTPGANVRSFEEYPAFLNYTDSSTPLTPAAETNPNDPEYGYKGPSVLIKLIKKVLDFFSTVFQTVSGWIDGITGKATATPVV
ncbi:MAG: hypothetical protein IJJ85_09470 [Clostridia bacterium]|nr:hypothetical protein [Clostridia bacterium]